MFGSKETPLLRLYHCLHYYWGSGGDIGRAPASESEGSGFDPRPGQLRFRLLYLCLVVVRTEDHLPTLLLVIHVSSTLRVSCARPDGGNLSEVTCPCVDEIGRVLYMGVVRVEGATGDL